MTETELMHAIMLEATRLGHRLMRNNVGRAAYRARSGQESTVPYGVGGKGGSDLIGWTNKPRGSIPGIAPQFQHPVPIFTAVEVKTARGRVKPEQERFLEGVRAAGGIAGVCRSVEDYRKLVGAE